MPIDLIDNNKIRLVFSYSAPMVEWVKKFNNRTYNPKDHSWLVNVDTNKCVEVAECLFKEAVEKKWIKEVPTFLPQIKNYINGNIAESKQADADIEIPCNDGMEFMPFQKAGIKYIENHKGITLVGDEQGTGKELVNGTPVLSENGFKPIETLIVGEKVYGRNGKLCDVTGVFPQGIKPIYEVTFSDNTKALVGLEHLWTVKSGNDRNRGRVWRTFNTEYLKNNLTWKNIKREHGSYIWAIPFVEPIEYPQNNLIIPPYILGTLIADGCLLNSIRFVPGDKETPKIVQSFLSEDYFLHEGADYGTSTAYSIIYKTSRRGRFSPNPFYVYIKNIGLNINGNYKFIPKEYLEGSVEQRKLLLAGLLDGDGTVNGARTRYSTASIRLANDIVTLVQSLGGMAVISTLKGRTRIRNGKESIEVDNHNISIRLNFNPFIKESNKIKWKTSNQLIRKITSIEYIKDDYATCISVNSPDNLYVIKDFIVTHNTIQAAGWINLHDELKKILIICPASLKLNWRNEIEKWQTKKRTVQILDSKTVEFWGDIQIVNYDILIKLFCKKDEKEEENYDDDYDTLFEKSKVADKKTKKDIELKREIDYQLLVCDESHYIKNYKSLRSKALKLIAKQIPYKLFLTGTPILNRPLEAFNMLNLLRPDVFGSWWHYTHKFCNYRNDGYGIDVKGSSNLDELNDKLRSTCMIRRLKEDVLKELPEKRRSVIPVEGDRKIINKSQEILDKIRGEVETSDKASVILGEIEKLRQQAVSLKLDGAAQEFIRSFVDQEKKIIVFLHHKFAVEKLCEWLEKEKIGYAKIVGDVDAEDRQAEVNKFQNDKTCMVFVGSIHAAGVGITLTAACDTLFLELDWVPAWLLQAESRNHRIGTKNTVNIYYMVVDQTIEMDMMKLLEKKFKIVAQAVDGVKLDESTRISMFEF